MGVIERLCGRRNMSGCMIGCGRVRRLNVGGIGKYVYKVRHGDIVQDFNRYIVQRRNGAAVNERSD